MSKKIGTCGLCLGNAELQRSHLFPAAAYKRMRNPAQKNPNPVMVTRKAIVQTSLQTQDYFLCSDCEQRLSRNGEHWVMQNCWQSDGTFPLHLALKRSTPVMRSPTTLMYAASKIKEIDIEKLAYFAASVFWRASAHDWHAGKVKTSTTKGLLGPYEENLRKYLLGEQSFPIDAALWVAVPTGNDAALCSNVISPERASRKALCIGHRFLFLGIGLDLYVGKGMDDSFRKHCFVRGDLITQTSNLDAGIAFQWGLKTKGRVFQ